MFEVSSAGLCSVLDLLLLMQHNEMYSAEEN